MLCRILTELKLLSTPVGVIVLSAGVGNDVVGWVLLALCVALVNAGNGITALWVLLVCVGYSLFLAFAVRPAFMWTLRRTRALQDGPSQGIVTLTLVMALASAFFTGVIGIHPVFGAFMAGLICPHEGGFAIKVTEKIEDLVGALFLPLYFTLSGLSTNIGLLNNGITWAYVIGVISVAFCGKFIGCSLAARLNGLVWREAFTIGSLMSCKGLIELIVLNIGLQAKILSTRTFTIFVVMALVTTFGTTPLTRALYPPWYQRKLEAWKRGEIDWDTGALLHVSGDESDDETPRKRTQDATLVKSLLVYLRLDSMPTLLALLSLLGDRPSEFAAKRHPLHDRKEEQSSALAMKERKRPVEVHGMRLLELTERGSTVMKVSEVDEYTAFDPVLNTFRALGQLYNLAVSGEVAISPESSFAESLVARASEEASDLLLLPWSETGSMSESQTVTYDNATHKLDSDSYATFIARALDSAECNAAVFVNRGFSGSLTPRPSTLTRRLSARSGRGSLREHLPTLPNADRSHHVFVPYFSGRDGRAAVKFALQLARNPEVTATIVHYRYEAIESVSHQTVVTKGDRARTSLHQTVSAGDREEDAVFFGAIQHSLDPDLGLRVVFQTSVSSGLVEEAAIRAREEVDQNRRNGGDIVILGRHLELSPAGACLGSAANMMLEKGVRASLLVVQAGRNTRAI